MMPVVQLLRAALKHAGNRPPRCVMQTTSAVHGVRTHASSCTDGDKPKVLITG